MATFASTWLHLIVTVGHLLLWNYVYVSLSPFTATANAHYSQSRMNSALPGNFFLRCLVSWIVTSLLLVCYGEEGRILFICAVDIVFLIKIDI